MSVFESLNDDARIVVRQASTEAAGFWHNYVGTEHLLLGLIHYENGVVSEELRALGITRDRASDEIADIIGYGGYPPSSTPRQFTPRANHVFAAAIQEAHLRSHDRVAPSHLLYALLGDDKAIGTRILLRLGVDIARLRDTLAALLEQLGSTPGQVAEDETLTQYELDLLFRLAEAKERYPDGLPPGPLRTLMEEILEIGQG